MDISQLVYRSLSTETGPGMERMVALRHIHSRAMTLNRQSGITGFLAFTKRYFLQVLEGERIAVTNTFDRILKDRRHKDIELLAITHHGHTRSFGKWAMGAVFDEEIVGAAIRKNGELDVMALTAAQTIDVLRLVSSRLGNEDQSQKTA